MHTYLSMLPCPFSGFLLTRKTIIIFVVMILSSVVELMDLNVVSSVLWTKLVGQSCLILRWAKCGLMEIVIGNDYMAEHPRRQSS